MNKIRCIDADEFKRYIIDGIKTAIEDGYPIESLIKAEEVTNSFLKDIDEQEIIDAVIVTHGHWKHLPDYDEEWGLMEYYRCSECDCVEFGMTNYCPNCGAKMDLEEYI